MNTRTTLPLYLGATATSLFGNSAIAIVLPWLVLERTGDPAVAGTVAAISAVPSALAAFAGGHLIDKLGRRRMSVISDTGSALAVAALAAVDAVLGLDVGWFIVLGVLGALFDVPGMTARETLVADVARTSGVSLEKIASLRGALFGLSFLAGPAVAGLLLAFLPAIHVVWITAGCSGIAALAIAAMPLAPGAPAPTGESSPMAGFNLIRRSRPLIALLAISCGSTLLTAPLLSVVLPAHFNQLAAPGLLGLTLSGFAVGTMVGSVVYGWLFDGRSWAAWVVAHVLYVVAAVLIATLTGFWLVGAGMVALGLGSGLLQPIATVVLTTRVPEQLRGRVFGTYTALAMVVTPLGLGLVTAVLAGADLRAGAWTLAAGWVIVVVFALVAPGLRDYIRTDTAAELRARQEAGVADDRPAG